MSILTSRRPTVLYDARTDVAQVAPRRAVSVATGRARARGGEFRPSPATRARTGRLTADARVVRGPDADFRRHDGDATHVGSDATDDLSAATTVEDVDRVYRRYLSAGDVPDYVAKDYWVTRDVYHGGHKLRLLVAPDYAAIGTDDDPLRIGKSSEAFAQEYADAFNAILPSQKLLRDLESSADVKIPFIAVQRGGGADDSVSAVVTANDKANAAFKKYGVDARDGKLKLGYKKAYVVRPGLNGDYLAIYGGRWSEAGGLVQPTSGHAHTTGRLAGAPNYSDYSHGIVLISRKAWLDDELVDLRDVFLSKDPSVWGLVSDEGPFDPRFPSVGAGSSVISHDSFGAPANDGGGGGSGTTAPAWTYSASDSSFASVQRALMKLGYSVGVTGADGKPGPSTSKAIVKFKQDHGISPATDVVDGPFRAALASASSAAAASASGGGGTVVLLAAAAAVAAVLLAA